MGQKWYVVTVGKKIGVFDTWLEVAPLVKGVPGAVHQSFPSKDIAYKLFEQEHAKGNTRIVDMTTAREYVSCAVQQSYMAQPEQLSFAGMKAIHNDARMFSASRHSEDPSNGFNAVTSALPTSHKQSPSIPRPPVQRNTIMSTAVVRSPSWLPAYPSNMNGKSNESPPLSPLMMHGKAGLSSDATRHVLHSKAQFRSSDANFFLSPGGRQARNSTSLTISSTDISDDDDPIILPRKAVARPMRGRSLSSNSHGFLQIHNQQTLYDSKSDPRSPMGKRVMSPLPSNSVLFGRPSPYITSLPVDAN